MGNGKKLLVLTEAGDNIGYGHYTRCYAIKQYCDKADVPTDILLNVKGDQISQFKDVTVLDWGSIERLNAEGAYTHVLIDSYLAPISIIDELKSQFRKVVALDDYRRIDNGPDLIINPNVFGDKITYSGIARGGSRYIILRNAFNSENRKNEIRINVANILITLGGNDVHKLIPLIVNNMLKLELESNLHIIAGSEEYQYELEKYFAAVPSVIIYGFVSAEKMRDLMLMSDLVISACGQTLHELAWLAVPTIGICVGDDQILNIEEYVTKGFLSAEIYWDEVGFNEKFHRLLMRSLSYEERRQKSHVARTIATANGLENIFTEIFN